jgi:hypothetical protein
MERRITSPAGGFAAPPSLQDAHTSSESVGIVERYMSTMEKHLRKLVSAYQNY